jgi:hypothetical protein
LSHDEVGNSVVRLFASHAAQYQGGCAFTLALPLDFECDVDRFDREENRGVVRGGNGDVVVVAAVVDQVLVDKVVKSGIGGS